MAYTVLSEKQAEASEHTLEALKRLKAVLDANAAVLKSGGRAAVSTTVFTGAQHAVGRFPAIQAEAAEAYEEPSGMRWGAVSLLYMRFRLFAFDIALGRPSALAENLAQFSDRIQAVLRKNRTLDGFCRNVRIDKVVHGRLRGGPRSSNPVFASHPILAAQIDATVEKAIERD